MPSKKNQQFCHPTIRVKKNDERENGLLLRILVQKNRVLTKDRYWIGVWSMR